MIDIEEIVTALAADMRNHGWELVPVPAYHLPFVPPIPFQYRFVHPNYEDRVFDLPSAVGLYLSNRLLVALLKS